MKRVLIASIVLFLLGVVFNAAARDEHDHDHEGTTEQTHPSPHQETAESDRHEEEHADHEEHKEGFVRLTDEEMAEFGIVLDTAGPGSIRNEIVVPGEVAVNGDRIAHIVPRFPGVVKQVLKRIGDHVQRGDVLAVVESNEGLTPYNVLSLMEGTVIDKQINVGDVHGGDQPAFIIADLDTVWVNLSIYQMHLASVRTGQLASITADHGIHYENGTISYISPIVDEHTRTAIARVVLDNRSGKWRPGLLVEGRIATDSYRAAVVVPKSALFHMNDVDVVFLLTPDGFKAQPVQLGRTNHTNAEIIRGLEPGQVYASKGGFTIKAEMQKGSFGDGHEH